MCGQVSSDLILDSNTSNNNFDRGKTWLRLAEKHASPEVFQHCHVITSSEVLVEAFDAGNGEVLFSPLLSAFEIEEFAHLMKVKAAREAAS